MQKEVKQRRQFSVRINHTLMRVLIHKNDATPPTFGHLNFENSLQQDAKGGGRLF